MLRMTCNPLNLLNLVPQVKIVECRNVTICKIWNHRVGVVPVTAWCHYWPIVFLLCHSSSIPEKYKYRKIWRLLRLWRNLFLHANVQNQDCEKGRHDTYLTLHLLITCIEKLSFGALQLSNHTWLICISDTGSSVPSCADPASPPSNKRMPGEGHVLKVYSPLSNLVTSNWISGLVPVCTFRHLLHLTISSCSLSAVLGVALRNCWWKPNINHIFAAS